MSEYGHIMKDGFRISRREALRVGLGGLAVSAFAPAAVSASPTYEPISNRSIKAFIDKFPEQARPFLLSHQKTWLGREDIHAFARSKCNVEIFGAIAEGVPQKWHQLQGVAMGFARNEDGTSTLYLNRIVLDMLNIEDQLDHRKFSAVLSNEATHAIQYNRGVFEAWTQIRGIGIGDMSERLGLALEMASDARMLHHIYLMTHKGMLNDDDARKMLKEDILGALDVGIYDAMAFARKQGASVDTAIIMALKTLWNPEGPQKKRVELYFKSKRAIGDATNIPNFTERHVQRLRRGIDESASVENFTDRIKSLYDPILNKYMPTPPPAAGQQASAPVN